MQAGRLNELIQVQKQRAFRNRYSYLEHKPSLLSTPDPSSWPSLGLNAFSDISKSSVRMGRWHSSAIFVYFFSSFLVYFVTGQSASGREEGKNLALDLLLVTTMFTKSSK